MNPYISSITNNRCLKILKKLNPKCKNITVKSFEFDFPSEQKGFLGEHGFLKITYMDNGGKDQLSEFFVKTISLSEPRKIYLIECGIFSKESVFYKKLVPLMLDNDVNIISDVIPKCYFSSENEYLIFENLNLKGYVSTNWRLPLNIDMIKVCLDALAKLYCSGLILEEKLKEKLGKSTGLAKQYPEVFKDFFRSGSKSIGNFIHSLKKGTKTQVDLYNDDQNMDGGKLTELIWNFWDDFKDIIKPSSAYRNTICHGDLWASNFMFKYENSNPTHACIVDFQMFRYAPPGEDLMLCLHLTTDREFRQKYMTYAMEHYYCKISAILTTYGFSPKEILCKEEFVESCEFYKLFACAIAANHNATLMIPPEYMKNLVEKGKVDDLMFEERSATIRDCWEKYESYRNKIRETVADLRDVFVERNML